MAVLNNETIKDTLNYLATLENILDKELRSLKGNRHNLDKIVPENIKQKYTKKEKDAEYFTANLYKTYYEASVITLVASFEQAVFSKYKNSYGTIKSVVGTHATIPLAFYKSREKFVNGGIDKLHGIIELIEGHIDNDLLNNLKRIKDQRDYLAHGKRFGAAPAIDMKLEDIAILLDQIISEIER